MTTEVKNLNKLVQAIRCCDTSNNKELKEIFTKEFSEFDFINELVNEARNNFLNKSSQKQRIDYLTHIANLLSSNIDFFLIQESMYIEDKSYSLKEGMPKNAIVFRLKDKLSLTEKYIVKTNEILMVYIEQLNWLAQSYDLNLYDIFKKHDIASFFELIEYGNQKRKKNIEGFVLKDNKLKSNLSLMLDSLKHNNYIDTEVKLSNFKVLFSEELSNKKVNWKGSLASLNYFVRKIGDISINSLNKYNIAINFFTFNFEDIKLSRLRNNNKPTKIDIIKIDKAIKNIY